MPTLPKTKLEPWDDGYFGIETNRERYLREIRRRSELEGLFGIPVGSQKPPTYEPIGTVAGYKLLCDNGSYVIDNTPPITTQPVYFALGTADALIRSIPDSMELEAFVEICNFIKAHANLAS